MNRYRVGGWPLVYHYVLYLGVIAVAFTVTTVVSVRVLREAVYATHRHDLDVTAQIVHNTVPAEAWRDGARAELFCLRAAHGVRARITLMSGEGRVLGDSAVSARELENHRTRPEVVPALNGEVGYSTRYSTTLKTDLMYAAVPTIVAGRVVGVTRTAIVVNDVEDRLAELLRRLVVPVVGVLVLSVGIAFFLTRAVRMPLRLLHQSAVAYGKGDFGHDLSFEGPREVAELAVAFSRMAAEQRTRLAELKEQRRETEEVLDTIREPLLLINEESRIARINAAATAFFHLSASQVKGRYLLEVIRNSTFGTFVARLRDGEHGERVMRVVLERYGKTVELWGVHLTSTSSLLQGHSLIVLRDVTREERLEQIRREFVANVSHELKTPITAIQGAIETLLDMDDVKPIRRRFERMIAVNVGRMGSIIEDLLNLARVEQSDQVIERERCSVERIVRRSVQGACERYATRVEPGTVTVIVDGELTWLVQPSLMRLAISNLLDNALKYGGEGATITVRGESLDDAVVVTITDSGPGIPALDIERIFERFYRVDQGRSRETGGTGLGLSIVRHIVQLHGGTVYAESEIGEGACFTITVPRSVANENEKP